jgi:hypothetical protein
VCSKLVEGRVINIVLLIDVMCIGGEIMAPIMNLSETLKYQLRKVG